MSDLEKLERELEGMPTLRKVVEAMYGDLYGDPRTGSEGLYRELRALLRRSERQQVAVRWLLIGLAGNILLNLPGFLGQLARLL